LLDIRPILFINGFLLLILAAAMAVPMAVDLSTDHTEWQAFGGSLMTTSIIGLAFIFANRTESAPDLRIREAFLLTVSSWLLVGVFAALPLYFGSLRLSLVDGLFETISGITTTGATVITGLDRVPRSILVWRALLQWLGGLGIIVTSLALLPLLHIGGMQMFRMESSDKTDKVKPRVSQMTSSILIIYVLFTVLLAIGLLAAGMSPLEAVCHAMTSLSTGGFSTSDQSLGHFGEGARWICTLGMVLGGATFSQYITPWKRGYWAIFKDSQIRWYLSSIAFFSLLVTFWNWAIRDMNAVEAFSQSTINVVSILTTSGFHTVDYDSWGGFAQVAFFIMTFVGGCTGSTAGGIKVFRYEVLFAVTGVQIRRLLHPHGMFVIDFNRLSVSEAVLRSVLGFMMLYFFCIAALALALTVLGLDAMSSLSAAAASLGNVGPGLGHVVGPGGSYANVAEEAKWLLAFGMLLGRLELATVLVLFAKAFWQE
jgi:trk system potassium uptake protein TrkH